MVREGGGGGDISLLFSKLPLTLPLFSSLSLVLVYAVSLSLSLHVSLSPLSLPISLPPSPTSVWAAAREGADESTPPQTAASLNGELNLENNL